MVDVVLGHHKGFRGFQECFSGPGQVKDAVLFDLLSQQPGYENLAYQGHPVMLVFVLSDTEKRFLVGFVGSRQGVCFAHQGQDDFLGFEFLTGSPNHLQQLDYFVTGLFFRFGVPRIVIHLGSVPVDFVKFLPEVMKDEFPP